MPDLDSMPDAPQAQAEPPPIHQWTHDGSEVLIVKCVKRDGSTHGGFRWPLTVGAEVVAPDWSSVPECGGGLHGWHWGLSIGDGKEPEWSATWLVFGARPTDVVDLGGKVKARTGVVRYVGDWVGATSFVLSGQMALVIARSSGAASATGWSGAAVVTGLNGRAQAGPFGMVALAFWNSAHRCVEMRCREVGVGDGSDGKLKARVWYRLDDHGNFIDG